MKNKNLKLKIKKIFFQFAIFYLLFTIFTYPVFSQTSLPLTVIPARNQIEVEPGEKISLTINFYNQSDSPISGFFKVADFIVVDNKGAIQLIENPDDAPAKYSGSKWVKLLYDRATIASNEKVSLQANISVPKDAHPGGRYVAVFFQSQENIPKGETNEEIGSGTTLRISSLIYIKVKGEIKEKALISRFFVPNFLEYGPIKVTTDILNRGDYHITPRGIFNLTNYFGANIDQKTLKEKNIFPETSRNYEVELGKKWMIGQYKITFLGSYGEKGQALTASSYVIVFPWRVVLVVILTLIIIYLISKNLYENIAIKEKTLEEEIKKEKEEIEKLKKQLEKRD